MISWPFLLVSALIIWGLWILVNAMSQDRSTIWDWLEGGGHQPRSVIPLEPLPPPKPKVSRNFGAHHNPLSLLYWNCQSDFEQVGERTWQCPVCGLIQFEKPASPQQPSSSSITGND